MDRQNMDRQNTEHDPMPERAHYFWVHPEKQRWYAVRVTRDLFGAWLVVRAWGSLRNRLGGERCDVVASPAAAAKRLRTIARQRQRHGYLLR